MASDSSFDVVSKVELQEVKNAIDQAIKEISARFDLKDSKSKIELEGDETIQLASADDYKLKAVVEILSQKLVKRGVSLKNLEFEKIEQARRGRVCGRRSSLSRAFRPRRRRSSSRPSRTRRRRRRPAFRATRCAS